MTVCPEYSPRFVGATAGFQVGFNAYYLQEEAARAVRAGLSESGPVEETFHKARALGITWIRTWAFNDDPAKAGDSAMQVGRLVYDEVALQGLDEVLSRAHVHGVKLVLPLGNYWKDYGGTQQYVAWAGLPDPVEGDPRFFTERPVIDHYKEHIQRLLDRTNTRDGLRYGEHPAVLGWELLNEPRNTGLDAAGEQMRAWIDEVAARLRQLAPGHAIGTGEEGFDAPGSAEAAVFWMRAGVDFSSLGHFRKNLQSPHIDFGSVHFFPESWGIRSGLTEEAGRRWIHEHAAVAQAEGKPLLLAELGLRNQGAFPLEQRRAMYQEWFRCARRAGLAGVAPWMFANDARPDAWDDHTFYFRDGTAPGDPANRYADLLVEAAASR